MSVQHNNPGMAILVGTGAAVTAWKLLKIDGTVCGLSTTKDVVGVTQEPRAASTTAVPQYVPVRFLNAGSCKVMAAKAITAGTPVYKAAAGKITDGSTGSVRIGLSLEAATADGDIIEILPD